MVSYLKFTIYFLTIPRQFDVNRRAELLKTEPNTMITVKEPILKTSQKLDILRHLFSDRPIASLLQSLEQIEIAALKAFIWDKTIEFGIRVQGKSFSQESILTKIRRLSNVTNKNTLSEQQAVQQIETIFEIAKEYVHHVPHPEMTKSATGKVNSI